MCSFGLAKTYLMNTLLNRTLILLLALLIPVSCFAANGEHFRFYAVIIKWLNVALYITSAISIKQYFFLGDKNQTNFQIFNLIFGVVFYIIALSFLIEAKSFYVGFEHLSASQCISRFYFDNGIYSLLHWMVIVAMVFNILYIRKYHDA
jgi:hypothetical protein